MSQHLIKLSVGVKDVNHLARLQERRLADAEGLGKIPELKHVTRNTPKRAAEILKGGVYLLGDQRIYPGQAADYRASAR